MNRLNILHKFFALAVVALFAVNQAMLIQIQQNVNEVLPELRIKNEVAKQGTGKEARVVVKLQDEKTVTGFISRIADDRFTVTNPETREETMIAYRAVVQIDKIEPTTEFVVALIEIMDAGEALLKASF